ncbi:S1/P1 nuclease [Flavobacterium aciduliphilum]|uniref:S1/P1 nuclease n=1 Tax=Flavobacterium aciduliphilum TaxID=1101402 RepID=A0A328YLY4_9FLAO|nr:S1/P1 nuclease [Flavobacterium aciduliphilum]RAR71577.1 S1/P1 nuclease [Flavobacterium aciduliphilum]
MKKMLVFIVAFAFLPLHTFAWGEKGHRIVAEIAFKNLDRKTRKIILQYLDGMSIEEAANWMDAIKKDHSYDHLKPWHYVNFEKNERVKDTCCDNIIYRLSQTIETLKKYPTLPKATVKMELCYLFHLMGDLHQPLHVGYGSDKGGNSIHLKYLDKKMDLHGLFDYGIIEAQNIKLKHCLKYHVYTKDDIEKMNKGSVLDWAKESRSHLTQIYSLNGNAPSEAYITTNEGLIKQQLQVAGIRLAELLKTIFSQEPK